jgi:hypothetical protein
MPRLVKATLSHPEGETQQVEFELTDRDLDALNGYVDAAKRLLETKFVQGTLLMGFRIHGGQEGMRFDLPEVDREEFAAFLHFYRPIILETEPWSFEQIRRMLGRHYRGTIVATILKDWHRQFEGHARYTPFTLKAGTTRLDNADALELWLNAHEYHRDADKRTRLEELLEGIPSELFEAAVRKVLREQLQVVAKLCEFCSDLLSQRSGETRLLP